MAFSKAVKANEQDDKDDSLKTYILYFVSVVPHFGDIHMSVRGVGREGRWQVLREAGHILLLLILEIHVRTKVNALESYKVFPLSEFLTLMVFRREGLVRCEVRDMRHLHVHRLTTTFYSCTLKDDLDDKIQTLPVRRKSRTFYVQYRSRQQNGGNQRAVKKEQIT